MLGAVGEGQQDMEGGRSQRQERKRVAFDVSSMRADMSCHDIVDESDSKKFGVPGAGSREPGAPSPAKPRA